MAMNYYSYFTKAFLRAILNFSYFLLENKKKLLQTRRGFCFSYVFFLIIISSVLYQCPKSLVLEVMVSGMDFFQNAFFVVLLFSTTLEVFDPSA